MLIKISNSKWNLKFLNFIPIIPKSRGVEEYFSKKIGLTKIIILLIKLKRMRSKAMYSFFNIITIWLKGLNIKENNG